MEARLKRPRSARPAVEMDAAVAAAAAATGELAFSAKPNAAGGEGGEGQRGSGPGSTDPSPSPSPSPASSPRVEGKAKDRRQVADVKAKLEQLTPLISEAKEVMSLINKRRATLLDESKKKGRCARQDFGIRISSGRGLI